MSLTMAQGMKRIGLPIASLIGVALIGLISTSWFLDRDPSPHAVEAPIPAMSAFLRRARAIRLARRPRRLLDQLQRLRCSPFRRPIRRHGPARQRAAETGV